MARVAPGDYDGGDGRSQRRSSRGRNRYHHHVPNPQHFNDLGVSNQDKNLLVNFEKFTVKDSKYILRSEANDAEAPMKGGGNTTTESVTEKNSFITCDSVAFFVVLAYVIALAAMALGCWCFTEDSRWNRIVRGEAYFPEISSKDFFAKKTLYFNHKHSLLGKAQTQLLREKNRTLEIVHLAFVASFLLLAMFQCAAYVSRGTSDHTRIVVIFYGFYGGLGLLLSILPIASWTVQAYGYASASQSLDGFSKAMAGTPKDELVEHVTNSTAADAQLLSRIMKFCSIAHKNEFSLEKDSFSVPVLDKGYKLKDLQKLGFCTHHRFKVIVAILTFIFSLLCCCVPCMYCFDDKFRTDTCGVEGQGEKQSRPPQPLYTPRERDAEKPAKHFRRNEPHYKFSDGRQLTEKELYQIHKFKDYVEQDSD